MLLSNVFSDMFDDMFSVPAMPAMGVRRTGAQPMMSCDVKEFDDHYELDMELAGFKKGDIQAELKDGYLTIKAERGGLGEQKDDGGRVVRSERFMGTCQRTFYVGEHVQREDVGAAFEDGVLKLNIPKKAEQPKVDERHFIDIQ